MNEIEKIIELAERLRTKEDYQSEEEVLKDIMGILKNARKLRKEINDERAC